MSGENTKKLIRQFFDSFGSNDVSAALSVLNDAVIFRGMCGEGALPVSSELDKQGIAGLMGFVADTLVGGLKITYKGWTIDGERVAVEMESYGKKADGTVYNNHYHFLVIVSGGKITELREYSDTYHVWRVFVADT